MQDTDLTYGQKAVGVSFNPSKDPIVDGIKKSYADIIDILNTQRTETPSTEKKRLISISITEAQGACMWAVKGITYQYLF